jgi:hypothetical protein
MREEVNAAKKARYLRQRGRIYYLWLWDSVYSLLNYSVMAFDDFTLPW